MICAECQCEDHNDSSNHNVHKVEEVSGNVRNIIENKFKELDNLATALQMNENDTKQHQQGISTLELNFLRFVSIMLCLDVIQSAETSLLEVDRIFDLIAKQVESRRCELKQEIENAKQVCQK